MKMTEETIKLVCLSFLYDSEFCGSDVQFGARVDA